MFIEKPEGLLLEYLKGSGLDNLTHIEIDDDVLADEYAHTEEQHGDIHTDNELMARSQFRVIWRKYGIPLASSGATEQAQEDARSRELTNIHTALREQTAQHDDTRDTVIAAVNEFANGIKKAVSDAADSANADLAQIELEARDTRMTFKEEAVAVRNILKAGFAMVGLLLVALTLATIFSGKAHGQIDGLQVQDGSGTQIKQWMGGIARLKFGTGFSCSLAGSPPVVTCTASGGAATGYQTIQNATVAITQRTVLNWLANTITCVDNAGATRSDCGFAAQPAITDFTNAPHDHSNAAGGGQISTTAVASGNKTGNGTQFATGTGTYTSGNCVKIDASGNLVDNGSTCGGGTTPQVLCAGVGPSASSPNAVTDIKTCALSAGVLSVGDQLRFFAIWKHTGTVNTPRYNILLGSSNICPLIATGTTDPGFMENGVLSVTGAATQFGWCMASREDLFNPATSSTTGTETISGALTVHFQAQLSATDTIQLLGYSVERIPAH